MDFTAGAVISGRYRLDRKVGAGGMGEVWLGVDVSTNGKIAVKTLLSATSVNAEIVARFKREAYFLEKIKSDYVARVVEFIADDSFGLVLVMEYIEGEALAKVLQQKTLTVEETIDLGVDIAHALQDLHRAHVVHRDLKPGNIIMRPLPGNTFRGVVVDFGVSRIMQSAINEGEEEELTGITRADMAVGTIEYMAPEQILNSRQVTAASDIYALGAMMFRAAAGRHIFGNVDSDAELAQKKLMTEAPALPLSRSDMIAKKLIEVVGKASKRRPAERYRTADEMLADLLPIHKMLHSAVSEDAGTIAMVPNQAMTVPMPRAPQTPPPAPPPPRPSNPGVQQAPQAPQAPSAVRASYASFPAQQGPTSTPHPMSGQHPMTGSPSGQHGVPSGPPSGQHGMPHPLTSTGSHPQVQAQARTATGSFPQVAVTTGSHPQVAISTQQGPASAANPGLPAGATSTLPSASTAVPADSSPRPSLPSTPSSTPVSVVAAGAQPPSQPSSAPRSEPQKGGVSIGVLLAAVLVALGGGAALGAFFLRAPASGPGPAPATTMTATPEAASATASAPSASAAAPASAAPDTSAPAPSVSAAPPPPGASASAGEAPGDGSAKPKLWGKLPTAAPTGDPTAAPTVAPTGAATVGPKATVAPIAVPKPTVAPTAPKAPDVKF